MSDARHTITLADEPRGDEYRLLLDEGVRICEFFSLVQRHEQAIDPEAVALILKLKPFMRSEREVSEWPGTQLLGGTATLREFDLSEVTAGMLGAAANGLYEWCQPGHPEDLVLWRSNANPWLVSIAHERDAYLCVTPSELRDLLERRPKLRLLLGAAG